MALALANQPLNAQMGQINAQMGQINAQMGQINAQIGQINAKLFNANAIHSHSPLQPLPNNAGVSLSFW
jgi:prefoldin subunit 5